MAQLLDTEINGNLNVSGQLQIGNTNVGDFIIEQNVNGIWTYRKWNSGISECWGTLDYKCESAFSSLYNMYVQNINYSLPSNVFTSAPEYGIINTEAQAFGTYYRWKSNSTNVNMDIIALIQYKVGNSFKIYMLFKGKWK